MNFSFARGKEREGGGGNSAKTCFNLRDSVLGRGIMGSGESKS